MKKRVFIIYVVVVIVVVGFIGTYMLIPKGSTEQIKYADARLSALQLKEGLEYKIKLMSIDVIDARAIPTEKGLSILIDGIKTLRVYGKDISKEAKQHLNKIVNHLKISGYENRALLKQLDELVKSSHVVSA